ncbi:CHAT domain-containing protein [Mycena pura]|uniref:CHAT domain-containing protein n=1 Tax=Mycena pura TaxID=153505 RepID=A0AAD6UVC2_9AGAR|nr:CHAT domain-containing protein [Mycena pura]
MPGDAVTIVLFVTYSLDRFRRLGDLQDLEASLQKFQAAMELTPKGHPDLPRLVWSLGIGLHDRFQRLGDLQDLEAALQKFHTAVELTPKGHQDLPQLMQDLGIGFRDRFRRLGDLQDLEAALQKFQGAVELAPQGHPDLPVLMGNLGSGFHDRFQRLGDLQDLEAALQKFQGAVESTPKGHRDLPRLMQDLGIGFKDRFRRLGDLQDLEASLQKFQAAMELTPKGHPDLPRRMWSLGIGFRDRFRQLGDLQDLEAALQEFQGAVELAPQGHPDLPGLMQHLGTGFHDRFQRLGDLQDLEAALQRFQRAVELTPKGHRDLPRLMQDLGIGFRDRFRRLGDLQDLEAALQEFQAAMELTPKGHPDLTPLMWSLGIGAVELTPKGHQDLTRLMQDLGIGLHDRFQRLGDLQDLEAALQKFQGAVELTPKGHPDLPQLMQHLGTGLHDRFQRLGDLQDLEAALQKFEEAVELSPKGHPNLPQLMRSLGEGFNERFQRLGDLQDLEASLQEFHAAMELTPKGHRDLPLLMHDLGIGFRDRFRRLGDLQDLEAALQKFQGAVELSPEEHPDRPRFLQNLADTYRDRYLRLKHPQDLNNLFSGLPSQNTIMPHTLYQLTWKPSNCCPTSSGLVIPYQLNIGHATSTAFRICVTLPELHSAVEFIEQGIATIFQQTLQLQSDVDQLLPDQRASFRRLSDALRSESSTDPLKIMGIVNQRNTLLAKIRQQSGLEYFLLPKPCTVLQHASQGGPVIILNSHDKGCDGMIVLNPSAEPVHLALPGVTVDLLKSHRTKLTKLIGYRHMRGESTSTRLFGQRKGYIFKRREESFADMLSWLWTLVVAPVYQVLQLHGIDGGRVWWLPTGAFAGLPLHACPPTDQFIHSYTATLGSLLEAYAKKASGTESKLGVVGVTYTGARGLNRLEGVEREIVTILSIAKGASVECLQGEKATPDAVKKQLQDCSWVHFACHGKQDLVEPTKSHLLLYGGILELQTILQMPVSNREFAFLAACQTAMGDSELVNESFHLGGGFIAAGFRAAVGTLWSMEDQDGPLVAEIMYSHLFRNGKWPEVLETAEALHLAVKELKKRGVPYERWVPFIHMGI